MSDDRLQRQTATVGDFLSRELGIRPEDLTPEIAARALEIFEETGLIPSAPVDWELSTRLGLRHLHRSAALIRKFRTALDLRNKENSDET